jgi:hypothetical protein
VDRTGAAPTCDSSHHRIGKWPEWFGLRQSFAGVVRCVRAEGVVGLSVYRAGVFSIQPRREGFGRVKMYRSIKVVSEREALLSSRALAFGPRAKTFLHTAVTNTPPRISIDI